MIIIFPYKRDKYLLPRDSPPRFCASGRAGAVGEGEAADHEGAGGPGGVGRC